MKSSNRWRFKGLSGQIKSLSNLKRHLGDESCLSLSGLMLSEGNMFSDPSRALLPHLAAQVHLRPNSFKNKCFSSVVSHRKF